MRKIDDAADKAVGRRIDTFKAKARSLWQIGQYVIPIAVALVTAWAATVAAQSDQLHYNAAATKAAAEIGETVSNHEGRIIVLEKAAAASVVEHQEFKAAVVEIRAVALQQREISGKLDTALRFIEQYISRQEEK